MLPEKALHELREIIARDYGVAISDDQAQELGVSLLRLTRVAVAVLARKQSAESVDQQPKIIKEKQDNEKK